jgi:hypothetical protein
MTRLDGLLLLGWLLGLATQIAIAVVTGYGDVFPPQLLLALALCTGAGFRARRRRPTIRGRDAALAGAKMMGSIVVGYFFIAFLTMGPNPDSGGETWLSLLVEAPFWVGLPLSSSLFAGYLGYRVAGRTAARGVRG